MCEFGGSFFSERLVVTEVVLRLRIHQLGMGCSYAKLESYSYVSLKSKMSTTANKQLLVAEPLRWLHWNIFRLYNHTIRYARCTDCCLLPD